MKNFKRTVLCTVIALSLFGCDRDDNDTTAGIDASAVSEASVEAAQTAPKNVSVVEEQSAVVEETTEEAKPVSEEAKSEAETPAVESAVEGDEVKQGAIVESEVKAEPEVVAETEVKQEVSTETIPVGPAETVKEEAVETPTVEIPDTAPVVEVAEPATDDKPAALADETSVSAESTATAELVAESVVESATKPVTEATVVTTLPVAETTVAEPVAEAVAEAVSESVVPVAEPAVTEAEPVAAPQAVEETSELIEKVKAYIYDDIDPTLKVGSALKTRQVCESVAWVERVDRRERDTAVYSCSHNGYEDYFDNLANERLSKYVEKAEAGIPALKANVMKAEDAFNSYSWYLSFIEHLQEKDLIDGLIKIKNEETSDYRYLSYLISPNREQYLTDRTQEIQDVYTKVFDILDSMLGSNEVGETVDMSEVNMDERERLYDDIVNNGFKEFIDIIVEKGDAKEAIEFANGKAKVLSDALNEASGQLETLEYQVTDEGMKNRLKTWAVDKPVNVVSSISFAMGKDRPYVVGCSVSFYTSENVEKPVFVKTINNANTCLAENYKEDYDAFYHNSFEQFYQSRIN